MYGGNNKTFAQIATEVKETVIGQDTAVDWLCAFTGAASERSRLIEEEGADRLSLPNIGSALLVGPTASGKSHLLKTFAKASGLLYHAIDANQMSAENYKGDSFSAHWFKLSAALENNPRQNALIFIDEIDKLFCQERDGSALFDLLKPLEGGILEENGTVGRDSLPFKLDLDRCIFVLAGAFTGIEEQISSRLAEPTIGFAVNQTITNSSEESLRKQISLDDIESWGAPRELVGRFSTVHFMNALNEEALTSIIRNIKQKEYGAMFAEASSFTIDTTAEDFIVQKAHAAAYGARSINQQLNDICFGPLWMAYSAAEKPVAITLTTIDDALTFDIKPGKKTSKSERNGSKDYAKLSTNRMDISTNKQLPMQQSYELINEIRKYVLTKMTTEFSEEELDAVKKWSTEFDTAEHSAVMLRNTKFNAALPFNRGFIEVAGELLSKSGKIEILDGEPVIKNNYSPCEVTLLRALYTMLKDWFRPDTYNYDGLKTLVSLAEGAETSYTPLKLMFTQIENGKRYVKVSGKEGAERYSWEPSNFCRNSDNVRPGDLEGLKPSEDESLGYYHEFLDFSPTLRAVAVNSLKKRLGLLC